MRALGAHQWGEDWKLEPKTALATNQDGGPTMPLLTANNNGVLSHERVPTS